MKYILALILVLTPLAGIYLGTDWDWFSSHEYVDQASLVGIALLALVYYWFHLVPSMVEWAYEGNKEHA